jgi:malonyl-CoA O-methyltransferase
VLAPGGVLCAALFGARTLHELRDAWRCAAGTPGRVHRFFTRDDLAAALDEARLEVRALEEEDLVERHPDARAVLRALKDVGASSAAPGRAGLGGRGATLEALRLYEARHAGPSGVPATYHVLYAVAVKPR